MIFTPHDVLVATGETVTDAQVSMAETIVETVAGVDLDAYDTFRPRDQKHLQTAVCFQAVYLSKNPLAASSADLRGLRQGDLSIFFSTSRTANFLSPVAGLALTRLSWLRTRTIPVVSEFESRVGGDDEGTWVRI